jgi:hypothetical protein
MAYKPENKVKFVASAAPDRASTAAFSLLHMPNI